MSTASTVGLGIVGAASWGTADFCGGLASRQANAYLVILVSQFVGLLLIVAAALGLGDTMPGVSTLGWGALVGAVGVVGIVSLYRGLAIGPMSVVAPVSAVLAAALPIPVSFVLDGSPSLALVAGFALGLAGIWLVARGQETGAVVTREALVLAIVAGMSFGLFYVILNFAGDGGVLWPLAAARVVSVVLLAPYVLVKRPALPGTGTMWTLVVLAGLLDAGGNVFFILVSQAGRLDVAAVLLSLYPAATAVLAFFVLKERLVRGQVLGLVVMGAAIVLMTAF